MNVSSRKTTNRSPKVKVKTYYLQYPTERGLGGNKDTWAMSINFALVHFFIYRISSNKRPRRLLNFETGS